MVQNKVDNDYGPKSDRIRSTVLTHTPSDGMNMVVRSVYVKVEQVETIRLDQA
jgi:hypothetical protein